MLRLSNLVVLAILAICQTDQALADTQIKSAKEEETNRTLAELSKFSEGEILITEHCLAALYYYPNELTGKPNARLVSAIHDYMKDRPVFFNNTIQAVSKNLIDKLIADASSMNVGGLIEFRGKKFIKLLQGGDTLEVSGIWEQKGEPATEWKQEHERIVCIKSQMNCHSVVVWVNAPRGSGFTSYRTSLYEYKIDKFDDKELIARSVKVYSDLDREQNVPEENWCNERVILVNLSNQSAIQHERRNPDKIHKQACHNIPPATTDPITFVLVDDSFSKLLNKFDWQKTVPVGQKGGYARVLDAMGSHVRSYLKQ